MSGIGGTYYYHPSGNVRRRVWPGCTEIVTPVLVLDLDDREKCGELVLAFREALGWQNGPLDPSDTYTDAMQAALRSLLDPKPEEPKGLGAVVRDREGHLWTRARDVANHWTRHDGDGWLGKQAGPWFKYADIDVAEVLSPGVPEDGAR